MLAYFEQSAARYLELLEQSDELDGAPNVSYSQDDLRQKMAKVNQRIQELTELKDQS